ncbi:hypothetical protein, partial [Enterococcus faecalis]
SENSIRTGSAKARPKLSRKSRSPITKHNKGKTMARYQIIVSNLGTVLDTERSNAPIREYLEWVQAARELHGRAAGECVALTEDGEPIREHDGYAYASDACA